MPLAAGMGRQSPHSLLPSLLVHGSANGKLAVSEINVNAVQRDTRLSYSNLELNYLEVKVK